MFSFIKNRLQKIYSTVTAQLSGLFAKESIDAQTLKELEQLLIQADTGVKTTRAILDTLNKKFSRGELAHGTDLHKALQEQLMALLATARPAPYSAEPMKGGPTQPTVFLMVGINGSGKTTFTSKLAHHLSKDGNNVLLVAADTFRAAATEQLTAWAQRTNTRIITGIQGQDPASVVFAGCDTFKKDQFDCLIIDTAGRLQTKTNLMKELEKIKKTIQRQLPNATICTLLTVDAMLGQNSFEQAKLFHESTQLDGIVLTKMDGTGKGGIVFAITQELGIPIIYLSFGEQLDDYKLFNAHDYVQELLSNNSIS